MTTSLSKILIANRGEIACRVIRTARRLGIATVAVYSDADRHALHVREADEAVHIGGSASSESYLSIEAILKAVKESAADAVHPGFGFLSENSKFADALEAAGVTFIGPGTHAIEVMGDKITSKKLAQEAGVNTVPGHPDAVADADEAYTIAEKIGCPVMLKASAGGGGKGMRVAQSLDEVRDGFRAAQNEARTAFADDRVFVLHERECSIQRRHQKVIEEAPSSFISPQTRRDMGEQAVTLAKAVNYRSAGTVEFIVDASENFYFLEMNTRLQVEHPVTEFITGLDLVELMIDVAAGKPLSLTQDEIAMDGWSFEARVYAEDPDRGFLPSTGRITHYQAPDSLLANAESMTIGSSLGKSLPEGAKIRVDTGISAGGEISMFYDPMIAKLVTWGRNRDDAIEAMKLALSHYRIRGVQHNIPFLQALFDHPALVSGELTTRFIEDHFPNGFDSRVHECPDLAMLPLIAAWLEMRTRENDRVAGENPKLPRSSVMTGLEEHVGELFVTSGDEQQRIDKSSLEQIVSDWTPGQWLFEARIEDRPITVNVQSTADGWTLACAGSVRHFVVLDGHVAALMKWMPERVVTDLSRLLLSPMPGLLMKVLVEEGERIAVGQDLAIIEAMKMENTLTASVSGTVSRINAAAGDSLAVDAVIMEFET